MLKFLRKRRFRYGVASTIFTVVFVAVIIALNLLVTLVTDRYPINIDITSEGLYSLSVDTQDYVRGISQDVTITILVPEAQFISEIVNIIKNYTMLSDRVTFRSIDSNLNPQYMQKFSEDSTVTLDKNSIIIECGTRYKVLKLYDMFQISSDQQQITGLKAEQKLTSALMFVTSETLPVMYFTTGHNETVPQFFRDTCTENNIETKDISLLTEDFGDNAAFVVIAGPQNDFTEDEIEKIDKAVDKGNFNIIYFTSPEIPEMPRLDSYFAEWGLRVESDLVIDMQNAWAQVTNILPQYGTSDALTNFSAGSARAVVPGTSSVTLLFDEKNTYKTGSLLTTFDTAYAKAYSADISDANKAAGDVEGPLTLAATSEKSMVLDGNKIVSSKLAVFGSWQVATDSLLKESSFANINVMMALVTWMRGTSDAVTILPVYFSSSSLTVSTEQSNFIMILFVAILPLLVIALGIFIWVRRKRA